MIVVIRSIGASVVVIEEERRVRFEDGFTISEEETMGGGKDDQRANRRGIRGRE
jgi:hypothetical protein